MPTPTGLLAALIGGGVGVGFMCLAAFARGVPLAQARPPSRWRQTLDVVRAPGVSIRLASALLTGLLLLLLTRWPVAAVGAAALIACWPALFGGARAEQQQIRRLEALVIWTESLRDTVGARASLEQAIPSTAHTAPALIRPALIRMVGLLRARVPLDTALLALSGELQDASADKVIGALVLNTRQRGTGLADVLSAVARSARAELDQRRQITAGRASLRRSVQLVVAITLVFALFLVIFSRQYLRPYDSAGGQLALTVVLGLFASGFFWLRRMAAGDRPAPFLHRPSALMPEPDAQLLRQLTGLDTITARPEPARRP